jgi:hypothetical protein
VPNQVGDIRELRVESARHLPGEAVLPEGVAVVGEEDEQGVLE